MRTSARNVPVTERPFGVDLTTAIASARCNLDGRPEVAAPWPFEGAIRSVVL